jgi:hypothetical protein
MKMSVPPTLLSIRQVRLFAAAGAVILASFIATNAFAGGPTVTVSASPTVITDQGEETTFTLRASPPSSRRVAVNFVMGGTAFLGSDYVLVGNFNHGQIVLLPGQSLTTITLHTFDVDGPRFRTAGMIIIGGDKYAVGRPNSAGVKIQNVR